MNYVEQYGLAVLDGRITACDKIRRAYEKLLKDIDQPGRWHFDEGLGERPIEFIERFCRQSKGEIGKPIELQLFQKARIQATFGFVDDLNIRRYQEVLNVEGRKNGKTTETAGIELYMLLSDGEGSPMVYNVATAKDQAMLAFVECDNMRSQSPVLRKHLKKRQNDIYCAANKGSIKALASNTNSLDGLNAHMGVIDELAAIKNRDIYDLVKQSMTARRQPLLWCISTNGFVRDSIFDAQYKYGSEVLDGIVKDERMLVLIYELDRFEEWTDPEMWIKANPGLGTIKDREMLQNNVEKAKTDDAFRPTVLVKDFNLKQNTAAAWLSYEAVTCGVPSEGYPGFLDAGFRYGIGGFDAADSVDLTAAKMICMREEDQKIYTASMYWIPQRKMDEMKNRHHPDDAPYDIWAANGLLRVVEGNKVSKRVILDWFLEMRDVHDIYPLYIGYDPWHIDDSLLEQFRQEFGKSTMIPVRQGVATLSQPMKDLKAEFEAGNIVAENNPIDIWCLMNTYVKTDINGNIQPDKGASQTKRIDGTAALLDAYVVLRDKRDEYLSLI